MDKTGDALQIMLDQPSGRGAGKGAATLRSKTRAIQAKHFTAFADIINSALQYNPLEALRNDRSTIIPPKTPSTRRRAAPRTRAVPTNAGGRVTRARARLQMDDDDGIEQQTTSNAAARAADAEDADTSTMSSAPIRAKKATKTKGKKGKKRESSSNDSVASEASTTAVKKAGRKKKATKKQTKQPEIIPSSDDEAATVASPQKSSVTVDVDATPKAATPPKTAHHWRRIRTPSTLIRQTPAAVAGEAEEDSTPLAPRQDSLKPSAKISKLSAASSESTKCSKLSAASSKSTKSSKLSTASSKSTKSTKLSAPKSAKVSVASSKSSVEKYATPSKRPRIELVEPTTDEEGAPVESRRSQEMQQKSANSETIPLLDESTDVEMDGSSDEVVSCSLRAASALASGITRDSTVQTPNTCIKKSASGRSIVLRTSAALPSNQSTPIQQADRSPTFIPFVPIVTSTSVKPAKSTAGKVPTPKKSKSGLSNKSGGSPLDKRAEEEEREEPVVMELQVEEQVQRPSNKKKIASSRSQTKPDPLRRISAIGSGRTGKAERNSLKPEQQQKFLEATKSALAEVDRTFDVAETTAAPLPEVPGPSHKPPIAAAKTARPSPKKPFTTGVSPAKKPQPARATRSKTRNPTSAPSSPVVGSVKKSNGPKVVKPVERPTEEGAGGPTKMTRSKFRNRIQSVMKLPPTTQAQQPFATAPKPVTMKKVGATPSPKRPQAKGQSSNIAKHPAFSRTITAATPVNLNSSVATFIGRKLSGVVGPNKTAVVKGKETQKQRDERLKQIETKAAQADATRQAQLRNKTEKQKQKRQQKEQEIRARREQLEQEREQKVADSAKKGTTPSTVILQQSKAVRKGEKRFQEAQSAVKDLVPKKMKVHQSSTTSSATYHTAHDSSASSQGTITGSIAPTAKPLRVAQLAGSALRSKSNSLKKMSPTLTLPTSTEALEEAPTNSASSDGKPRIFKGRPYHLFKTPVPGRPEDDYGIDDLNSDDETDNEDKPKKKIPDWARSDAFRKILKEQDRLLRADPLLPFRIFPVIRQPDLKKIFPNKYRERFDKRTSSAQWDSVLHTSAFPESILCAEHDDLPM